MYWDRRKRKLEGTMSTHATVKSAKLNEIARSLVSVASGSRSLTRFLRTSRDSTLARSGGPSCLPRHATLAPRMASKLQRPTRAVVPCVQGRKGLAVKRNGPAGLVRLLRILREFESSAFALIESVERVSLRAFLLVYFLYHLLNR